MDGEEGRVGDGGGGGSLCVEPPLRRHADDGTLAWRHADGGTLAWHGDGGMARTEDGIALLLRLGESEVAEEGVRLHRVDLLPLFAAGDRPRVDLPLGSANWHTPPWCAAALEAFGEGRQWQGGVGQIRRVARRVEP